MKQIIIAALLVSNVAALAQKKKEKVEEIRLANTVMQPELPIKPTASVYQKWEIMAGVPKVSFWFFGLVREGDCFEWFYKEKGSAYEIVGVRDLQTKIVYWKKEYLK